MNIQPISIKSTNYINKNFTNNTYSTNNNLNDNISFSGLFSKELPQKTIGQVIEGHDKVRTKPNREYLFKDSKIFSSPQDPRNPMNAPDVLKGRIITAENCLIDRTLVGPTLNLKNTRSDMLEGGEITLKNSRANLINVDSQTKGYVTISDGSIVDCLTLHTNEPDKGSRKIEDNVVQIDNSEVHEIRHNRPSMNRFSIKNNSHIGKMDFSRITYAQILDIQDSTIDKFIDAKCANSKLNLHNSNIKELFCNPKTLKLSGENTLGKITFSCYYYEKDEPIEINIPKGTKIEGDICFRDVDRLPGSTYTINVEEGAEFNGNISVEKQDIRPGYVPDESAIIKVNYESKVD